MKRRGEQTANPPPADARIGREDRIILSVLFGMFAVAVGNTTAAAVAIPAIAEHFDAGLADVGWIVFGYSGAFAVATSVYGTLARRYGLGRSLVAGIVLVFCGGIIAGFATSLPMLIAGRVVQGLGSGGFPPLSVGLLARRLDGAARARAIGINVAAVGVGFALGPVIGGLALETTGWRAAVAMGVFVAPAAPILWRMEAKWDRPDRTAQLDGRGMALLTVCVFSIVFLLNRTPILGLSTATLAMMAVLPAAAFLLRTHLRRSRQPVFPWALVTNRSLWNLMLLGFIGQTAFLGTLVIVPVAAARVHGVDGFLLGALLLPMAGVVAVLSPRNGDVQARIGRPATTTVALTLISGASLLLAVLGAETPAWAMAAGAAVGAIGFSVLNAPLANEVTVLFPGAARTLALALYNLAFFMGTTSGSSAATAIVQADLTLAPFSGRRLPGYSTALVVIAIVPLIVALIRWADALAGTVQHRLTTR